MKDHVCDHCFDCLLARVEDWRATGAEIVWVNGCFDLLHVGHVRFLKAAARLGDVLIVGINSDESVERLKGPGRPCVPAKQRDELLIALECVDAVVQFAGDEPSACIAKIRPDIVAKSTEYMPPHGKPCPEMEVVLGYGGQMKFIATAGNISTSQLIQKIRRRKFNA